ncbi:hypothetical protein KXR64_16770 [Brucella intermedia]|uniref:hypothetical protein n=1 Tax=Brucella TaxID=234 RepID=UPI0009465782|nr:hypothetical protein [Brucella intermedia]
MTTEVTVLVKNVIANAQTRTIVVVEVPLQRGPRGKQGIKGDKGDPGLGDMLKSEYDVDGDGVVDHAKQADEVPWGGVQGKPDVFPPAEHGHAVATVEQSGFMSAADKQKMDDLGNAVRFDKNQALNATQKAQGRSNISAASLGVDGKVPLEELPDDLFGDIVTVSSEAEMLALVVPKGSIAVRTDVQKNFILKSEPASTLANWVELATPTAPVTSVAGRGGNVTLASADITDLGDTLTQHTVRFDQVQDLTPAQKGQARANIDAGILSGWRNKIINGDFPINQRGNRNLAPGENMIVLDRWYVTNNTNQTVGVSQQPFALGQTDVPGEPAFYLNLNFPVAPTSGTVGITQRIESVRTLANRKATVTAYTSGPSVNGGSLTCSLGQNFGAGGSPSESVITDVPLNIGTVFDAATRKRQGVIDMPSIAGKTLGTSHDGYVALAFTLTPRAVGNYSIAHVSVVEGDATFEDDPFSPRHIQQEIALCERYYQRYTQGPSWLGVGTAMAGELRGRITIGLTTTMRANPSASVVGGASYFNGSWIDTTMGFEAALANMVTFTFSVPAYETPTTAPLWLVRMSNSNNTIWGYIVLNAEL